MPGLPVSRRQAIALAAVLLLVLVLVGRRLGGAGGAPHVEPLRAAAPTAERADSRALVVHVVGAVRRPGLYRLPDGSRIDDAVQRAGGATRRADLALVNLAAPLADGLQVVVPRRASAGTGQASAAGGGATATAGPVHLNTATLEQLDTLPGVGPVTAQKILDYRQEHGAFATVDELDAIPGIGPARLEQLRDAVAP